MDTSDPGPSIDELRAACTRFLVGHGRYEAGTGESLAEYLVRLNDHLLGDLGRSSKWPIGKRARSTDG